MSPSLLPVYLFTTIFLSLPLKNLDYNHIPPCLPLLTAFLLSKHLTPQILVLLAVLKPCKSRIIFLEVWLKRESTCFEIMKTWAPTPVPPKKKKEDFFF
jgi:hypothetical protein